MMRFIISASLKLQYLVIVLALALLVFGLGQLRQMSLDVYPEFDPPLVEVQTEALGLSAAEVEALITVPMEADLLNGVAWLEEIHSESVAGLSSILLTFEPGTDPIRARQMVQERLTQAHALPNVSKPPTMLQPLSSTSRVMMVGLTSDQLSLIEMGVLARWNIKPRLMGVPGVANVAIWGQRERQLQVQVNPNKLRSLGVTLSQIIETTGEALWFSPLSYLESSTPGTAGWIDTPNQRLSIRHELPISSSEDLAKVAVVGRSGLLLGDVAKVVEDNQPLIGDAILNNGTGLLLVIEKFPGANTLEVTSGVEEALDAMRPGLAGVEIDTTVFRPANYIEAAIGNLGTLALIGLVLISLALFAFYRQWRVALISLVAIALSLIAAVFVIQIRGETFNMMVLSGLAAALIVVIDDAIVDVEKVIRLRQLKGKVNSGKNFASIILNTAEKIRSPLTFATLIILLAVIPVFFIEGLSKGFFEPLLTTYILAILISFFVALIVTPALTFTLLSYPKHVRKTPATVAYFERHIGRLVASTFEKPRKMLFIGMVIALAALASLPFLKVSLRPSFKQTDILIEWEAVPGTSRPEMNRITAQVSRELTNIEGVRNVGAHVGRAITGDAVVGINSAELWVNLSPGGDYDRSLTAIGKAVAGYPGVFREVSTYQPERVEEALFVNNREDLSVRIYGYDLEVLQNLAEEIKGILSEVDGVAESRVDVQNQEAQVEIEVDLAAAEKRQVKPGDIRRQATTLLSGLQVGNLYQEQKVFDVVVWGEPQIRRSLTDIESLMIETPRGQVPLRQLADIRISPSPLIINREAVSRYIDVEVKISGRGITSAASDIDSRLKNFEFPLEYHAEVLASTNQNQKGGQLLLGIATLCLIGIYLLMQASFSSFKSAAFATLSLPLALAGGVLGPLAGGGVLSIGSLIGFLAIFGLSIRNTLVSINYFQYLQKEEGLRFGQTLVMRGLQERISPIVTTSVVSALALLPFAVAGATPGNELLQPMAIVTLGGLITCAYVNLFIIPFLYLRFGTESRQVTR